MVFGVVGVMITTRILGPAQYGTYVTAYSIHQYAVLLGQAGIGAYLIRRVGGGWGSMTLRSRMRSC